MNASRVRVTAIGSGKGGTGKTLIAVNLACALAHAGERVLLCDADVGLANTLVHLGLDASGDLSGVLAANRSLADTVAPVLGGSRARGGFDLLAAPPGSGVLANMPPESAHRLVDIFRNAPGYDRVLLDLGAGVGATTLRFAICADEVMLVLTPDPAALTDAYAFIKLVLRSGAPMPSIVVNMAAGDADACRVAGALDATCRAFLKRTPEYLGGVPRDAHATESVRRQMLLLKRSPQAAASRAIQTLALQLHAGLAAQCAPVAAAGLR